MHVGSPVATVGPTTHARGRVRLPGDKSISHRYAMLAAIADGTTTIRGYSRGLDCLATLGCVRDLGALVDITPDEVRITGRGAEGLAAPGAPLDAQNSGTTMRLLTGILAAQPFRSVFVGDESLTRRPMRRIIAPLTRMGARIESVDGHAPLTIDGGSLRGTTYAPEVPSAQVKSCVLLAGLYADGSTTVDEAIPTRDHTERALETFGVAVTRRQGAVSVSGGQRPASRHLSVPGDVSGAAFWCALAAGTPGGDITIEDVGLNPSRTSMLDVLRRAGSDVEITAQETGSAEPSGTLRVRHRDLRSFTIEPPEVPGVIDEIPALAALAAMMPDGCTISVRGAAELRVKESDRISALAVGFRAMGAEVDEFPDGFLLRARRLQGGHVTAAGDHRLAMAFMIAATRASSPVTVHEAAVAVSYPDFADTLSRLTRNDRDG